MGVKPLKINIISDLHYYAKEMGTEGKAFIKEDVKNPNDMKHSHEILYSLMNQLAEDEPEIVLVSGDTTTHAEPLSHKGVTDLFRYLKSKGKRVFVITATHDYNDDGMTHEYTTGEKVAVPGTTREELFDIYREFGPDEAISIHRDSMSYVVQLCDGYRLFALNDDRNHKGASGFSDDCFEWIKEQIADAKANGQFIIPMTHHPMLSPSPFYKVIGGGNIMGEADKRIDEFTEMGLNFMFTGHTHMQDISYKYTENDKVFYDITTASAIGYPAKYRQVEFNPEEGTVKVDAVEINCEIGGKKLQEHLEDKFFGMIKGVIDAAASDIDTLARSVGAFSVSDKLIYKIGWLIKPFAKLLKGLNIGHAWFISKKESGVKKEEIKAIKERKIVDFIMSLVTNLYGGDSPYSPETPEYRITMGVLAIIDSILALFGVKLSKLLKGVDSAQALVEPLLYNSGICDEKAVLNLYGNFPPKQKSTTNFLKSKKAIPIVIGLVLLVILFLPIILIALGGGFIVNQIKYGNKMK